MENENLKNNEIEEIEVATEMEEVSDSSGMTPFLTGVLGGFVAYGIIAVAKKLKKTFDEKRATKNAETAASSDDATIIDIGGVQADTADEASGK